MIDGRQRAPQSMELNEEMEQLLEDRLDAPLDESAPADPQEFMDWLNEDTDER